MIPLHAFAQMEATLYCCAIPQELTKSEPGLELDHFDLIAELHGLQMSACRQIMQLSHYNNAGMSYRYMYSTVQHVTYRQGGFGTPWHLPH